MASEGERIWGAAREFEIATVDTRDKLNAAYHLRHQVFCVERGIFAEDASALESDRFDGRARHVLLTQRRTGRVVGTVRVVAPALDRLDADLPMQRACRTDAFRILPLGSTGEISRFAISKDLRDVGCAGNAVLRLGLLQGVLRLSAGMGLTHWCAIMEHTLLRLLRVNSIHFHALGPAVEHYGLRQPCWARIGTVFERVRRERPAVWDYCTVGGTLWREEEAAAAFA
jgi:N-acyl-L-homoserine lactone synthetase